MTYNVFGGTLNLAQFNSGSYTFTDLILQQAKDTSFWFGLQARTRDCLGSYRVLRVINSLIHTYIHT